MSENQSQQNNDYNKDINLLNKDLEQNTKATVHIDDVQQSPKQDFLHDTTKQTKSKTKHKSWLQNIFHRQSSQKQKSIFKNTTKDKPHAVQFQKGAKNRFDIDIKESSTKKQHFSNTQQSNKAPIKPEQTKPASTPQQINNTQTKILPQPRKSNKASIPTKAVEKKSTTVATENNSTLPSIKDLVDDDKEKSKTKSNFDVNLIPEELRSAESTTQAIKKIIIAGSTSILLVIIVFIGLSFIGSNNKKHIADLQQQVKVYEDEIQSSRDTIDKLASFTEQTQKVGELLQGREKWSGLFDMLEKDTIDNVYYKSVIVSPSNQVSLEVVARTYYDLARQYKIFANNPNITNIEMNSASLDTTLWQSYINLAKIEAEKSKKSGATSTQEFIFDKNKLKSLLTVNSTISFDYLINSTSTTLDRYESQK